VDVLHAAGVGGETDSIDGWRMADLQKDTKSSVGCGVALGQATDWPGEQEWTIGSEE
jgi:hypothetical protein